MYIQCLNSGILCIQRVRTHGNRLLQPAATNAWNPLPIELRFIHSTF